jgi:Ca2+-binding RTX toxin-like protein
LGGSGRDFLYGGNGDDTIYANWYGGHDNNSEDTHTNTLQGDVGNDTLYGSHFGDTLQGGRDDDTIYGGRGNDKYIFNGDFGSDMITDSGGTNTFIIDSAYDDLWFSTGKEGNLQINKLGTDEQISLDMFYAIRRTDIFKTKDGFVLDNTNLDSLIDAMAQFNPQDGITETFNPTINQQTSDLIAASWSKN